MAIRTHIFIDYENVQPSPEEFSRIPKSDVHVWLLHGAHQHDFSAALVTAWLPIGTRMQLHQSNKTGKNAVDVLLALHLGKAHEQDLQAGREGRYVIVSKDNDYSALLAPLKREGASLHRTATLTAALQLIKPASKSTAAAPLRDTMLPEDIQIVVEQLRKYPETQPKLRARLVGYIESRLAGKVTTYVSKLIIEELERRGIIAFDGNKVSYPGIGASHD